MESQGGSGFRGALARLRHAPLWVWLTVLLTFGLLVFAYLQYRKSAANSSANGTSSAALGTVPSAGSGQPLWSSADTSGMITGNGSDMQAILAYINSLQTPNPSPTATPTTPPPVIAPGPSGGVNPPTRPTTVTTVTFPAGTTINDVLKKYPGLSGAWLQSWNKQANANWFSHPWWQFPTTTKLNIPQGSARSAA